MQHSITALLCELKLLSARIEKEIAASSFVVCTKADKAPQGFKDVASFNVKAKGSLDSIKAMIARRNKIKAAIVKSNAEVVVKVGTVEYTVAEAIERKNSINFEKSLLSKLMGQFKLAAGQVEMANRQEESRLDQQLLTILGKDKADATLAKTITDNFWKENKSAMVDPCDAASLSEKLSKDIEDFLSNIDIALSISNAKTEIEIAD